MPYGSPPNSKFHIKLVCQIYSSWHMSSTTYPQEDCQDSRDSFTGNSQDGYPGYGAQYNNYPPGQGPGDGRPPQQHPGRQN